METFWRSWKWFFLAVPFLLCSVLAFSCLDRQIFPVLKYDGWILFLLYLVIGLSLLYVHMPRIDVLSQKISMKGWLVLQGILGVVVLIEMIFGLVGADLSEAFIISISSIIVYCNVNMITRYIALRKETFKSLEELLG